MLVLVALYNPVVNPVNFARVLITLCTSAGVGR